METTALISALRRIQSLVTSQQNEAAKSHLADLIHRVDRGDKIADTKVLLERMESGELISSEFPAELRRLADSMEPF